MRFCSSVLVQRWAGGPRQNPEPQANAYLVQFNGSGVSAGRLTSRVVVSMQFAQSLTAPNSALVTITLLAEALTLTESIRVYRV